MISPASTSPLVTERKIQTLFRVCGRDDQQGSVSGAFVRDSLKLEKVAVLHNKSTYGQGTATEFKKTFESKGGKVVVFDGLSEDELDFRATIANLVKAGAQAVFWGGMYNQGGRGAAFPGMAVSHGPPFL